MTINKYTNTGHCYITNVQHELTKASGFSIFIDLDWTNSFHQILLASQLCKILLLHHRQPLFNFWGAREQGDEGHRFQEFGNFYLTS